VRETGGVRVEAETARLADSVRDAVATVLPRVLEFEGFVMPRGVRLVAREVDEPWIDGRRYEDRIEIGVPRSASAQESAEGLHLLVAHELGHHLLDAAWRRLPALLEEGLVEFVAQRAAHEEAPMRRAILALFLAADQSATIPLPGLGAGEAETRVHWALAPGYRPLSPRDALELSRVEFVELPIDSRQVATALGWRLVEDRGLDELRVAVVDDVRVPHTPDEWWIALGRAPPPRALDLAEIRGLVGPAEGAALRRWRSAADRR